MAVGHPDLLDGRQGYAPGAVRQLAVEQLGRHGGLAVGAEAGAAAADELGHPLGVVFQGRALEHRHREVQFRLGEPEPQGAHLAETDGGTVLGKALGLAVQQGVKDGLQLDRGHGVSWIRMVQHSPDRGLGARQKAQSPGHPPNLA